MKRFLRRMNRGIALAVVLVIGLVTFLVVDNIRFDKERDVIRTQITKLLEKGAGMNVFPAQYNEPGKEIPESAADEKVKQARAFLETYYTNTNDAQFFLDCIETSLRERDPGTGIVYSEEYKLERVKSIHPQGSGYASARVEFTYHAEYAGTLDLYTVLGNTNISYTGYYGEEGPDDGDINRRMRLTVRCESPVELVKVDGQWKIRNSYVLSMSTSETPVEGDA